MINNNNNYYFCFFQQCEAKQSTSCLLQLLRRTLQAVQSTRLRLHVIRRPRPSTRQLHRVTVRPAQHTRRAVPTTLQLHRHIHPPPLNILQRPLPILPHPRAIRQLRLLIRPPAQHMNPTLKERRKIVVNVRGARALTTARG